MLVGQTSSVFPISGYLDRTAWHEVSQPSEQLSPPQVEICCSRKVLVLRVKWKPGLHLQTDPIRRNNPTHLMSCSEKSASNQEGVCNYRYLQSISMLSTKQIHSQHAHGSGANDLHTQWSVRDVLHYISYCFTGLVETVRLALKERKECKHFFPNNHDKTRSMHVQRILEDTGSVWVLCVCACSGENRWTARETQGETIRVSFPAGKLTHHHWRPTASLVFTRLGVYSKVSWDCEAATSGYWYMNIHSEVTQVDMQCMLHLLVLIMMLLCWSTILTAVPTRSIRMTCNISSRGLVEAVGLVLIENEVIKKKRERWNMLL